MQPGELTRKLVRLGTLARRARQCLSAVDGELAALKPTLFELGETTAPSNLSSPHHSPPHADEDDDAIRASVAGRPDRPVASSNASGSAARTAEGGEARAKAMPK